jgi:hypothetical protein
MPPRNPTCGINQVVTEAETVYCAVRNAALNITSIHFRLNAQIPVNYCDLFKLYAAKPWVDGV